ncbi:hypothetical protein ACLOJK_017392 [Asimina triloba]
MDPSEKRYLEDDDTPIMKTIKGATMGMAAGTIWGTVVATWYDVPRVERSVALPGLIRTVKMMGNYGITFAAIGGVYIGVEQLVQHYRMKRDFVNGTVGGFVAGASVLGFKVFKNREKRFSLAPPGLITRLKTPTGHTNANKEYRSLLSHSYVIIFSRKVYLSMIKAHSVFPPLSAILYSCGGGAVNFAARSIPTALSAGAALAFTSAVLDVGGQTTRIDNGKEYYAYDTQKKPSVGS